MKRFKIGFAAIVAILAISVTIASYAGAFKVAPKAVDCYQSVFACEKSPSIPALQLTSGVTNCSDAQLRINAGVSAFASPIDPATCVGSAKFCCAQLSGDLVNPDCDRTNIISIKCKN